VLILFLKYGPFKLLYNPILPTDWSAERLEAEQIQEEARPISPPLTEEMFKTHIKKNEISRNRPLAFLLEEIIRRKCTYV
jgi:hypothetical protein